MIESRHGVEDGGKGVRSRQRCCAAFDIPIGALDYLEWGESWGRGGGRILACGGKVGQQTSGGCAQVAVEMEGGCREPEDERDCGG